MEPLYITELCALLRINHTQVQVPVHNPCRAHWALVLKREGETVYRFNHCDYRSDRQHPLLLPKGAAYTWQCEALGECLSFEFECNRTATEPLRFTVTDAAFIEHAFHTLSRRAAKEDTASQLKNLRDFYDILATLFAGAEYVPASQSDRLLPAVQYMNEYYGAPDITNDRLAALCGISTVHFRQQFCRQYGRSPIAYLNALRLRKAQELLASDYGSIEQIAHTVGYNSVYHFSKMFRQKLGICPSRYVPENSGK